MLVNVLPGGLPLPQLIMKKILTLSALLVSLNQASAATVLYREVFGNPDAANTVLAGAGWQAFGEGGVGVTNNVNRAYRAGLAGSPSNLQSLPSVNSGVTSSATSAAQGYLITSEDSFIAFTNEYTLDLSENPLVSFSWEVESSSQPTRVAVNIADQWYVSQAVSAPASGWATRSIDFHTASWTAVNYVNPSTGTGELTLGNPIELPAGPVLLFGVGSFATTPGSGSLRMDAFTITTTDVVPEPSSMLLGLSGLLALMGTRRRRNG